MLKPLTFLVLLAATSIAADDREEKHHKSLTAQPTPREWRPGSVWHFVTTPRPGKPKPEILTLRVTNEPGVSCLAGSGWKDVWRRFVVIGGHVPFGPPIYQVEGRALEINLSGDMCDAYDIIDGVLSGGNFTGRRTTFGLGASTEVVGTVRGSLVQQ
jgi:hypothetical protein